MKTAVARLIRTLGHEFRDPALLEQALTHRSAGSRNNERLEFLGDAVLGHVIADELYRRFPDSPEGELSRLRASLVRKQTLAEIARELSLGDCLKLGSGELKSGGYRRDSILADALEALFGALYLDGGFEVCRGVIRRLFRGRLAAAASRGIEKDPKTRLQEYLQARQLPLPVYRVAAVHGEAHAQTFEVECRVDALERLTLASGSSRRRAEQQAAAQMLAELDADQAAPTQQEEGS
ncbi:ribonuclease III [Thiohalobacter sp. IOR34]|uniref:ribonuclease III n=1 Tax=Thiohalobacter sp. IOR34 TaxID=3057176 RepID=UPI0025AFE74D|nr:ribonuclease III [Thiohalobacter sp. IOR34]WJW76141.1 ribonuclease III [Thiohalobacter sp. IOR34]